MNKKKKIVMDTDPVSVEITVDDLEDSVLDEEEVLRRDEEIDQLTIEYILALMGVEDVSSDDIGIDQEVLESIENEFEEILYTHGLVIYRPTIMEDENGLEYIVPSAYEDMG